MSMISETDGGTSFFLKKSWLETNRFNRFASRENNVVHPKTVADHKDLQSFSMHFGTPITPVTRRSVSGSVTMFLNPSPPTKSTDDCTVGRN